jgi:hypothetical protein
MPPTPYCILYGGPGRAPLRIGCQFLDWREKALLINFVVKTPFTSLRQCCHARIAEALAVEETVRHEKWQTR